MSIVQAMLIHVMIVVGDTISTESTNEEHNGGHYGLAADGQLTENDLLQAEYFGKYVATVVSRIY